jgi:transcription initiation factor TFIIIB Brf1 subunit/transcription initiation factor TFIIB
MKCHSCGKGIDIDRDNYYIENESGDSYCTTCGPYIADAMFYDTVAFNAMDEADCESDRARDLEEERLADIESQKNWEEGLDFIPWFVIGDED